MAFALQVFSLSRHAAWLAVDCRSRGALLGSLLTVLPRSACAGSNCVLRACSSLVRFFFLLSSRALLLCAAPAGGGQFADTTTPLILVLLLMSGERASDEILLGHQPSALGFLLGSVVFCRRFCVGLCCELTRGWLCVMQVY
jgi:hypothetical protein